MIRCERQGAVHVVAPEAVLNRELGDELQSVVATQLSAGRPAVVVNLHAIPLIDSAGLEALLDLRDQLQALGGEMKLAAANPLCRDILAATGVSQQFRDYPSVKLAIGSFLA